MDNNYRQLPLLLQLLSGLTIDLVIMEERFHR